MDIERAAVQSGVLEIPNELRQSEQDDVKSTLGALACSLKSYDLMLSPASPAWCVLSHLAASCPVHSRDVRHRLGGAAGQRHAGFGNAISLTKQRAAALWSSRVFRQPAACQPAIQLVVIHTRYLAYRCISATRCQQVASQ